MKQLKLEEGLVVCFALAEKSLQNVFVNYFGTVIQQYCYLLKIYHPYKIIMGQYMSLGANTSYLYGKYTYICIFKILTDIYYLFNNNVKFCSELVSVLVASYSYRALITHYLYCGWRRFINETQAQKVVTHMDLKGVLLDDFDE